MFIHSKCNSLHLPTPTPCSSSHSLLPPPCQPQACSPCPWSVSWVFFFSFFFSFSFSFFFFFFFFFWAFVIYTNQGIRKSPVETLKLLNFAFEFKILNCANFCFLFGCQCSMSIFCLFKPECFKLYVKYWDTWFQSFKRKGNAVKKAGSISKIWDLNL